MTGHAIKNARDELFEVTGGLLLKSGCILKLKRLIDGQPMFCFGGTIDEALSSEPQEKRKVIEQLGDEVTGRRYVEAVA